MSPDVKSKGAASQDHNEDYCGPVYASEITGIRFLLKSKMRLWQFRRWRFQKEVSMKTGKSNTSLPERRQKEHPPPEKKPKWSNILGAVLWGILVWMPRFWKVLEIIFGWFSRPPS